MSERTITLYGALTRFSAEPQKLIAHDFRDVLSALRSWFPDACAFLHENPIYHIVLTGKDKANPRPVEQDFINAPFDDTVKEIHIIPDMRGQGIETSAVVVWVATALAVGVTTAAIIVVTVVSIAIGIVLTLLAPKPSVGNEAERPEERPSFLFNGPENVVEQGFQVPIVYGTHMTGSVVVSAGITVEHIEIPPTLPPIPDQPPAEEWQDTGNNLLPSDGY